MNKNLQYLIFKFGLYKSKVNKKVKKQDKSLDGKFVKETKKSSKSDKQSSLTDKQLDLTN